MAWTKLETELAAVVVGDLRARGWTVYQEVDVGGSVCDIVAVQGRVLWALECKLSLGLGVLAQARGWLDAANLVSVAVLPPSRHSEARRFALDAAKAFGIGVLKIGEPKREWCGRHGGRAASRVYEDVRPALRRKVDDRMRKRLHDRQQDYAPAGNADGKRYTAFAGTCDALREVLRRQGKPVTIKEALRLLAGRHHYASEASARGALYKWADEGVIKGVTLLREGPGKPVKLVLQVTGA